LFAREYNEALVHQVVVAFQANARQGTRAQMDRAEVRHSTKKPWRQKGTGRARAGMSSSPLWRGGGRIFPNSPDENFTQKINKKMYRAGMASIFSQLARDGRLAVIDSMEVDSPKTKHFAAKLKAMGLDSVLVIADRVDDNLLLASRNLPNVLVVELCLWCISRRSWLPRLLSSNSRRCWHDHSQICRRQTGADLGCPDSQREVDDGLGQAQPSFVSGAARCHQA
jgi:large subunit ribosomal protein L4